MAIRSPCSTTERKAAFPGEYVEAANSPKVLATCRVSLRGKRIAAPVCALVRNDMQKERRVRGCKYVVCGDIQKTGMCQRVQERLVRKVRGNMPGVSGGKALGRDDTSPPVIARSEATWQSASPAVGRDRK